MRIIKPSVEILEQAPGLEGIYKAIEAAGRNCYQSSHLIGEDTAKPFVERMIKDGHTAMLEHGTVYMLIPRLDSENLIMGNWVISNYGENPYSILRLNKDNNYCITTNYRVLVEHGWLDDLKYLCEPTEDHERRVTARFSTQIAITREYNRHRVNSIAEESTRYCNYSKEKYGTEISINLPTWIEKEKLPRIDNDLEALKTYCRYIDGSIFAPGAKMEAIDWWLFANLACEMSYMKLIEAGWSAQQARTVLPLDTNTTLVHTAFVSDWQHFFDLRSRGITGKPHPDAKVLADELLKIFTEKGYIHGSDK